MRPVYFAPDPLDAHLVERLLAGEGIRAVVCGDYLFGVRGGIPLTPPTRPSGWVLDDADYVRARRHGDAAPHPRSEEHTSELPSRPHLAFPLLLEKKQNSRTL